MCCLWLLFLCQCDWVVVTETVGPPELQTLSCGPAFTETCADQDVERASAMVCASEQLSVNQARPVPLSCAHPLPHPHPHRRLTAELLRLLCAERQVREQVKLYEGVPVLLSLLHSDHLKLLWSVVWILVQICEDPETSVEIRIWGGIKQLLHILRG